MMSNMTSESEDIITSSGCINSPTIDDVGTERNVVGSGPLKKGPWTSAEDAILVDYVNKHGEGNWNAVQKHSGLSRCGKSCRLRWANHLRPDLKKGAFTPEEEHRIIELHAKMGNKWARMAVELPGRTDNEIKNFWNTRTKRRQRAGLPIYPPDICLQALNNEDTQDQDMVTFGNGDTSCGEMLPNHNFHIPAVEFKNLELNQELFPSNILDIPGSNLLDIPGGSLLPQGLNSTYNNFLFPMAHPPPKRVRRSDAYPGCGDFPSVDQYEDDKIGQSFDFSSQNLNNGDISSSSSCLFAGSHAFINGNTSSSDPMSWAMKMELPSLQYSTQLGSSCGAPSSPLPSLESVDTLIQCPGMIDEHTTKSDSPSPRNSGLLEAVLYESQNLNMSKTNNNNNLDIMRHDSSSQNLQGEEDWEAYCGPISPLGHSAASVFSEYTPISGSSLDEHQSVDTISVKREAEEPVIKQSGREEDLLHSRPDFLLGSNWFGSGERNNASTDPIGALLGDDFCTDSKVSLSPHHDKWDDISDNR